MPKENKSREILARILRERYIEKTENDMSIDRAKHLVDKSIRDNMYLLLQIPDLVDNITEYGIKVQLRDLTELEHIKAINKLREETGYRPYSSLQRNEKRRR